MKRRLFALMASIVIAVGYLFAGNALTLPISAEGEGGPTLKLHYHRDDGDYAKWDVWLWEEGHDGAGYAFAEEDGDMVATMDVTPGTNSIGFIVRTQEWTKDIDKDQFIDISEVVSGTVDIYVESGVEGYTKELRDDVTIGVKMKNARYDGNSSVTVTLTAEMTGDPATAFVIEGSDGPVAISKVTAKGNGVYEAELKSALNPYKTYTIAFEENKYKVNMPILYSTKEFEDAYTYTGSDLGYTYSEKETAFRVWAPTADSVVLKRYESGLQAKDDLIEEVEMTPDVNGTWVCTVNGDLNGTYYTYSVSHDSKSISTMDPYARSSGANGKRSMVLDLSSTDPEGWDKDKNPFTGKSINDAIIYEAHIRDITVGEDNGIVNQGKFIGMIEENTKTSTGIPTGLSHIKDLGVTHIHVLPMYDFGSLDESNQSKGVYNWGYDPVNYNIPEGTYSTDPFKGEVRVKEVKEMVKGFHDNGIAVVMDVVYNHVHDAGSFCINQLVPGYFSRITEEGTYSNGSGCGNDTATERSMVRKYIVDSVNYWADEYHIDGFRFDLVGLMDTELINEIVESVHEKHPDVIFYGEGWSLTTLTTKEVELATQTNSGSTPGFAYFNDTIRDGLKGSVFNTECGFVSGASGFESKIARCFMGADKWCKSPSQTINYASCHDNNTLYDRLRISRSDASDEDIVKMNNLAAAIYMLSEGTPFMQAGEEMLRTKTNTDGSFESNSYVSGDAVNRIDWSTLGEQKYADVYDYYKGLIAFRKAHPVLRLTNAEDVSAHVKEITGQDSGMVAFLINGEGIDDECREMYVVFNASEEAKEITLPEGSGKWDVYINGTKAGNSKLYTCENTVTVEPISALVLVQGARSSRGAGRIALGAGIAGGVALLAGASALILRKKKTS